MRILNDDLSIQVDKDKLRRKPIGFVTRGDFSQARGHGMGIGVIANSEHVTELMRINKGIQVSKLAKSKGKIVLFRTPNSLMYQVCLISKLKELV